MSRIGLYDPTSDTWPSEGAMSKPLRDAVERFQGSQRLSVDGMIRPGEPTESRINLMLRALEEPAMNPGLHDRNGRPIAERMAAFENRRQREATPGALAGRVGPGLENHPEDVAIVGNLLTGHDRPDSENVLDGRIRTDLFDELRSFQSANGLNVDGTVTPDGETQAALLAYFSEPGASAPRSGPPMRTLTGKTALKALSEDWLDEIPLRLARDPGDFPWARISSFDPSRDPFPYNARSPDFARTPQDASREVALLGPAARLLPFLLRLLLRGDRTANDPPPRPLPTSPADPVPPFRPSPSPAEPPFDPGELPPEPPQVQLPDRVENVPPVLPPEFEYIPEPDDELRDAGIIIERWGGAQTRADMEGLRRKVKGYAPDWKLIGSRPKTAEVDHLAEPRYGPAKPVPGRSPMHRGSYADLGYAGHAKKRIILIQHQTTLADGVTPDKYERDNAARLLEDARAAMEAGWEVFVIEVPKRRKNEDGSYEDDDSYWGRTDPLLEEQLSDLGVEIKKQN